VIAITDQNFEQKKKEYTHNLISYKKYYLIAKFFIPKECNSNFVIQFLHNPHKVLKRASINK